MSQEEAAAAALTQAATTTAAQITGAEATAFRSPENLAKLLVTDDAPAKAPEPTPAPAPVTPPSTEAAKTPEPTPTPEPAPATPADKPAPTEPAAPEPTTNRPGTPDKVIQQLQQDSAAASRKLDELLAKVNSGQTLTPKETAQAEQAKRKIDALREKLTGGAFDALNHGSEVAESVVELDQQGKTLAQQLAATQARLDAMEEQSRQRDQTTEQARLQTLYPKVDVDGVFQNALAEAARITGIDPAKTPANTPLGQVLANAANSLFHDRAAAAVKSIAGKAPAPAAPAPTPTPKPAAPVTPNGARFTQTTSGVVTNNAPTSDWRAQYVERARLLVKD